MGERERKQNREIRAGPRERRADSDSWAEKRGGATVEEREREKMRESGRNRECERGMNETETFRR